jgi:hypothetical protein
MLLLPVACCVTSHKVAACLRPAEACKMLSAVVEVFMCADSEGGFGFSEHWLWVCQKFSDLQMLEVILEKSACRVLQG